MKVKIALLSLIGLALVAGCGSYGEANGHNLPDPNSAHNYSKLDWIRLDSPKNYPTIVHSCFKGDGLYIDQDTSNSVEVVPNDPTCNGNITTQADIIRIHTKECNYPQGYPGPGVTITSARIYKRPVNLPEGRAWKIHGHVDGVVDCNIKQGFIQITIQRHTRFGRSPHMYYRWQTVAGSRVTHNLAGQNIGDTFTMVVPGEVCQGVAEYRFRIHMSDLILKDNSTINGTTVFSPNNGHGVFLDCRP